MDKGCQAVLPFSANWNLKFTASIIRLSTRETTMKEITRSIFRHDMLRERGCAGKWKR